MLPMPTRLYAPWGIAVGADGSIYATEDWGRALIKMNAAGVHQWAKGQAGVSGDDNNHFGSSQGNPAVDASGRVYVPDTGNNRVQIYSSTGSYVATLGSGGQGNYQFGCPGEISISPVNGDIYVADQCNQRVQVFTSAQVYKATLGQTGHWGLDNWSFNSPRGVAVDRNGNIYVADTENDRIQKCTLSACSTFVGVEGTGYASVNGASVSDFSHLHPTSVAVDAAGRVYVSDDWSQRVQVFDSSGAYLASIGGSWGQGNSQLVNPTGVAVDAAGNVYVADKDNQRIEKFAAGYPNWTQANVNGFGNVANTGLRGMTVFNGQLYAGTHNEKSGAEIWRTSDGQHWIPFSPTSTGADTVMDMKVFGTKLYIGLSNGAGGEIWRTDGSSWEQMMGGGFGDPKNYAVDTFTEFSGQLYAVIAGYDGVLKVYRSSNGADWNQVVGDGFGGNGIYDGTTMYVYGGYLYLGLGRGSDPNWVAELWRTSNGTIWTPVFTDGLGSSANTFVSAMAEFNGEFYIGLRNVNTGGELWKSTNGVNFTPVFTGGNGNPENGRPYDLHVLNSNLYLTFSNMATGAEVWRSSNGATWSQISSRGWGDEANGHGSYFDKGAAVFKGSLYTGVLSNSFKGAQIWRYNNPPVTTTLISSGSQDGWVLESAENSSAGGTMDAASTSFYIGDDAANKQYRGILSFNTEPIPDGAVITSATLKIQKLGQQGAANPFLTLGNITVDIKKGSFGAVTLQATDFQTASSKNGVLTFTNTLANTWYSKALTAANLTFVNEAGVTQFRLEFTKDDNNNHLADFLKFYSGNAPVGNRPQLIVQYTP